MQLESQIWSALATGSPLPTSAGERVYSVIAPEKSELPRVTFVRTSTTPQNSLSGHANIDLVFVQVDCWARTAAQAAQLAREVRAAMGGADFKALARNEFTGFERESRLYRSTVEFSCWDMTF